MYLIKIADLYSFRLQIITLLELIYAPLQNEIQILIVGYPHYTWASTKPVFGVSDKAGFSHPFLGMGPGPMELGKLAVF